MTIESLTLSRFINLRYAESKANKMNRIIDFFNINTYPEGKRKQFKFNISLGILVMIFFLIIKDTAVIQASINGWLDYYIMFRMKSGTDTHIAAQNITFLDFDNKSFQILGKPDITPRDKIAELLAIAYGDNAKIVVLDFDFSEPDYTPSKILGDDKLAKSGSERDQTLFSIIEQIKNDTESQTKILLPLINYADKTIKHNIFKSLIDNQKVFAVTPTLTTNQIGDNYARFWLPYLEVKDKETSERKILWSIPLLSAGLYSGNFEELEKHKNEILNTSKDSFIVKINQPKADPFQFYREKRIDGGLMRDTTSLQYNRIQYVAIPPNVLTASPLGTVEPSNIGHWRKTGLDNKRIDCQDKIVIIGRSDEDCADFFATPCGNLPGMYIHGNGTASILGATHPHLAPLYKYVLLEMFLIILTAYLFLVLNEMKASFTVVCLKILCLALNYIYFCYTNEFVYMSFCFLFLGVYNFINSIQRAFIVGRFALNSTLRRFFRRI